MPSQTLYSRLKFLLSTGDKNKVKSFLEDQEDKFGKLVMSDVNIRAQDPEWIRLVNKYNLNEDEDEEIEGDGDYDTLHIQAFDEWLDIYPDVAKKQLLHLNIHGILCVMLGRLMYDQDLTIQDLIIIANAMNDKLESINPID